MFSVRSKKILPAVLLGLILSPSFAQDVIPTPSRSEEEVATKIDENRYRIGKAVVDRSKGEIVIEGKVNMQSGLIELLACTAKGKLHESILVLDVEPIHLQTALILLDMKAGRAVRSQQDPDAPTGDPMEVWVSWVLDDAEFKHRGEDLILNVRENKPMQRTHWVFTGSRTIKGGFAAQEEGSLITTYNDPNTIIDNPLSTGKDDELYEANPVVAPEKGTPVTVTLRRVGKPDKRIPIFEE